MGRNPLKTWLKFTEETTFELLKGFSNPEQVVNTRPSVRQYGVLHQAAFHGDIEDRPWLPVAACARSCAACWRITRPM